MPRGYDALEFSPQECARDFPRFVVRRPRRVRMADEERAMLRRVTAAFSDATPVRGDDGEAARDVGSTAADAPPGVDVEPMVDGSSRLYRD
ncbi:hypothetical protein V5F53_01500 [Xanthobacter sp. V4C-4]|uniref:hypothetical protein n=1 Tax=Xanthobacter cornucopiae TaxID=3119924 RepID=UPI00372CDE7D